MIFASTFLLYDHRTVEDLFLAQWIAQELGKRGIITWNNPWEKLNETNHSNFVRDFVSGKFPKESTATILISKEALISQEFVKNLNALFSNGHTKENSCCYIPVFLEKSKELTKLMELPDVFDTMEYLKNNRFKIVSSANTNHVKRGIIIAENTAQFIFERLNLTGQNEIALYIDQRGENDRNGEPPNIPYELKESEVRSLVFRPNLNKPRSQDETLYGNDWDDFRNAISWAISKALGNLRGSNHKKIHILGDSQLGIPFFIGKKLNRTTSTDLYCYQPRSINCFNNGSHPREIPLMGGTQHCISSHPEIKPIAPDTESISLLLFADERMVGEAISFLKEQREDMYLSALWVKHHVFKTNDEITDYIKNIIELLRVLNREYKSCRRIYLFASLPFGLQPLLAANLQNAEDNIVFVEFVKSFQGKGVERKYKYAPLNMPIKIGKLDEQDENDREKSPFSLYRPKTKILFLAANPVITSELNLKKEIDEIKSSLKNAEDAQYLEFIPIEAVTIKDLREAISNECPDIIHFAGHGTPGGIFLEDDKFLAKRVSGESLKLLYEELRNKVKCVVLNSCYSEVVAKVVRSHVPYVVGTTDKILNSAAVAFSSGFYQAIGLGKNIPSAFQWGIAAVDDEDRESKNIVLL